MQADGTLPSHIAERFKAASVVRRLKDGQPLFEQGSRPAAMFGVLEGCVRVGVEGEAMDHRLVAVLGPSQWFGEAPLLDAKARAFTAVAHGECRIATVTATAFHALIRSDNEALLAVCQLVCTRYRQTIEWIEDTTLRSFECRLARTVIGHFPHSGSSALRLSQEMLATQLGVSRPTVNRQLAQWSRQGLIRVGYGRIDIVNLAGLEQLARAR